MKRDLRDFPGVTYKAVAYVKCGQCTLVLTLIEPRYHLRRALNKLGWKFHQAIKGVRHALWQCPDCASRWKWCTGHKRFEPLKEFYPCHQSPKLRAQCKAYTKEYLRKKRK